MEEHLFNQTIGSFPSPVIGEVRGVRHGFSTGNATVPFTLYDVVIWPQTPGFSSPVAFTNIPYRGQQSGGAIEQNVPLLVSQKVELMFSEDDYNRPVIVGKWCDKSTVLPADADTYPGASWIVNGLRFDVDKNENLTVSETTNNTTLWELVKVGGAYKTVIHTPVELAEASAGALKKLIHEEAAAVFNGHTHDVIIQVPSTPYGPTSKTSSGPSAIIGASHMTVDTKAK